MVSAVVKNLNKESGDKVKRKRLLALFLCMCALLVTGCGKMEQKAEFSRLGAICELATLKCYYHNVAEFVYGENNLFKFGYKKMWIEYGGIVTVGIDATKVTASTPDKNGVVKVTMPEAKVLTVDFDEDSFSETIDKGIFASITAKEKMETFAFAQADMEVTAKENDMLLRQGQERARKVIEEYIVRVGTALEKTYTVEWVEVE